MFGTFKSAFLAIAGLVEACVAQEGALTLNTAIYPGQYIASPDGRTKLRLEQAKMVLYKDNEEVFVVSRYAKMVKLQLKRTGNLELKMDGTHSEFYWESFTANAGVTSFNVTNDGNARLYAGPNYAGWSFWVPAVTSDQRVTRNMALLSPDFKNFLVLTSSVLQFTYSGMLATIVKATGNTTLNSLTLTPDGNIVVDDTEGNVIWTTNTENLGGVKLAATNRGELQLLTAEEKVVWKWKRS